MNLKYRRNESMMKKQLTRILSLMAAAFICASALGSCTFFSKLDEDGTSVFGSNGTENSTESSTEAETELPRFDYFSADMTELAQIDSEAYKDMNITVSSQYLIKDEDVEDYITYLRFQNKKVLNDGARFTEKEIAVGDTAYIYFRGEVDGVAFDGGSNMADENPYALSIGSGSFIEGFEEGLVGVVPNQTSESNMVKLDLKFPDVYQSNSDLAGKDVTFYVWVVYTVQYEVPEYDEKFITETLKYEAKTDDVITEHKAYLKQLLVDNSEADREAIIEDTIWKQIIAAAEIKEYPEEELDYYYSSIVDSMEYYMEYFAYMGYSFENLGDFVIQYLGLAEDADWEAELEKQSREVAAQNMLCHAIAQQENMGLTEEDFNKMVQSRIDYYKTQGATYTAEEIVKMEGEAYLKEYALYEKIYGYIRENCTVNYED